MMRRLGEEANNIPAKCVHNTDCPVWPDEVGASAVLTATPCR